MAAVSMPWQKCVLGKLVFLFLLPFNAISVAYHIYCAIAPFGLFQRVMARSI